jgi:hypothetical protein
MKFAFLVSSEAQYSMQLFTKHKFIKHNFVLRSNRWPVSFVLTERFG